MAHRVVGQDTELNVSFRGAAEVRGRGGLGRFVANDPGCVKTHTSVKCKKYNSPTWDPAMLAQYDLTLMMRNFFEIFYARNER
jgi:hypothetical protein